MPFSFGYCNLITTPLLCKLTKVLNIGIHINYRPVESGKIVSSIYIKDTDGLTFKNVSRSESTQVCMMLSIAVLYLVSSKRAGCNTEVDVTC